MWRVSWKYALWGSWLMILLAMSQLLPAVLGTGFSLLGEDGGEPQNRDSLLSEIVTLRSENSRLITAVEQMRRRAPSRNELSQLYESLGDIATANRVFLTRMSPKPLETGVTAPEIVIEAAYLGEFQAVLRFLQAVERENNLLRVTALHMTPEEKSTTNMTGTIVFNAYLR